MKFILRTLAVAATIYLISWLAPNLLEVDDFTVAIIVALVISLINTFVRPIVMFLAIPLRILTLGIITLVINGVFLLVVSSLVSGFYIPSLTAAIINSIIISIVSGFFTSKLTEEES